VQEEFINKYNTAKINQIYTLVAAQIITAFPSWPATSEEVGQLK